jgi:hypothetical protein
MGPDDFVEAIQASRDLIESGRYTACPCSQSRCEWHGLCFECVMIHRVKSRHLPECLQPILRERIGDLAAVCEMGTTDERPTKELWDHLYRVAPPKGKRDTTQAG